MPTNKELLLSLRDGFEKLNLFDDPGLNALRRRGQMIIRRVFGPDSSYSEGLSNIVFYPPPPLIVRLGDPETAAERESRERYWRSGQKECVSLIYTMLEDLELRGPEQVQGIEAPVGPKSNRMFILAWRGRRSEIRSKLMA
jgi:hypothetical protein